MKMQGSTMRKESSGMTNISSKGVEFQANQFSSITQG